MDRPLGAVREVGDGNRAESAVYAARIKESAGMPDVKSIERLVRKVGRVLTIPADADVVTAAKRMSENQVGSLVVVHASGKVKGIVTERDILNRVVAKAADPASVRVRDIMATDLISCRLETPIATARRLMAEHSIRHLPIVENGTPLGMVSSRDILAHELTTVRTVARQQAKMLQDLETQFPGITRMTHDGAGRVVI